MSGGGGDGLPGKVTAGASVRVASRASRARLARRHMVAGRGQVVPVEEVARGGGGGLVLPQLGLEASTLDRPQAGGRCLGSCFKNLSSSR